MRAQRRAAADGEPEHPFAGARRSAAGRRPGRRSPRRCSRTCGRVRRSGRPGRCSRPSAARRPAPASPSMARGRVAGPVGRSRRLGGRRIRRLRPAATAHACPVRARRAGPSGRPRPGRPTAPEGRVLLSCHIARPHDRPAAARPPGRSSRPSARQFGHAPAASCSGGVTRAPAPAGSGPGRAGCRAGRTRLPRTRLCQAPAGLDGRQASANPTRTVGIIAMP